MQNFADQEPVEFAESQRLSLFTQQSVLKTPSGKLEYTIVHRPRVTRRLRLELDAQGGLVIVAPKHWSRAHISAALSQNTTRVTRFLADARKRRLRPLKYIQGERHLFLGVSYSLVLLKATRRDFQPPPGVMLSGRELHIRTRQPGADVVRSALSTWYRQQAMNIFTERMQIIAQKAPWTAGRISPLKLRSMRRSWGNCSSKGVIKLNTHLIKTPLPIVDSVIAHELCHLEEMNHSKAFYALLEGLNPNWRQDRAILRSASHIYLHI